jgi:2-(1,2-epoxy-1,2-dihydrophenyl)acetyl-CoA isomerase
MEASLATALDDEAASQSRAFSTADLGQGAAAFIEKRPARFTGR